VNNILKDKGYEFIPKNKFQAAIALRQKIYTRHLIICETIYGTNWNVDFIVNNPDGKIITLIIECKWQQSKGSVDEKYPYLVHNIKEKSPYPAIIIIDGNGYKAGAKKWLERQIDKKLLGVFLMGEFTRWINLNGF